MKKIFEKSQKLNNGRAKVSDVAQGPLVIVSLLKVYRIGMKRPFIFPKPDNAAHLGFHFPLIKIFVQWVS